MRLRENSLSFPLSFINCNVDQLKTKSIQSVKNTNEHWAGLRGAFGQKSLGWMRQCCGLKLKRDFGCHVSPEILTGEEWVAPNHHNFQTLHPGDSIHNMGAMFHTVPRHIWTLCPFKSECTLGFQSADTYGSPRGGTQLHAAACSRIQEEREPHWWLQLLMCNECLVRQGWEIHLSQILNQCCFQSKGNNTGHLKVTLMEDKAYSVIFYTKK